MTWLKIEGDDASRTRPVASLAALVSWIPIPAMSRRTNLFLVSLTIVFLTGRGSGSRPRTELDCVRCTDCGNRTCNSDASACILKPLSKWLEGHMTHHSCHRELHFEAASMRYVLSRTTSSGIRAKDSAAIDRAKSTSGVRRIVFLAVPPIEELDLIGPLEVFAGVNRVLAERGPAYKIEVISAHNRP